ncbi:hypothetical protein [Flavivirga jejuensis]|uniref:Uncharacterized protein n=1 Tax=Flavivirga jejuensis TaxID=870487 RepID=A0ABT8WST3_9FLAO|nr:hypothetical protein [Flavivirga jejuensis]MDO5976230.1 hypothetical protein [Flavivirga jejuensis]
MQVVIFSETYKDKNGDTQLTKEESSTRGNIHILFREIGVIGFDNFWDILNGEDQNLDYLRLNKESKIRLEKGIEIFRKRLNNSTTKKINQE